MKFIFMKTSKSCIGKMIDLGKLALGNFRKFVENGIRT